MELDSMHHIQKHILKTLCFYKWARFRDMRPDNTDTNLYNYHLKLLMKNGLVEKEVDKGYRLSPKGLQYIDYIRVADFALKMRPKLTTSTVSIKDEHILLWKKHRQPFIGKWEIPNGKVYFEDASILTSAKRDLAYLTPDTPQDIMHRGVVEYIVRINGSMIAHNVSHVFTASITNMNYKSARYVQLKELDTLKLVPGARKVIDCVINEETFFYKYFDIDW